MNETPVINPTNVQETKQENAPKPPEYMVVLHNDDYTPFDFVIHLLAEEFHLNEANAVQLMVMAHKTGRAIVMNSTKDICETKSHNANKSASAFGFPLMFSAEP